MIATNVKRPRNVDWQRAAAILYGDWGTSKAYVIGLAFAVAGYASFWLIAAMCVLTALVGINYMIICRLYPDGGGVYASVRHRSEVISIVGAFLLIADYLVTAAISALSAFQYLGVPHPEKFAAAAILIIGLLNLLGPKHTGGLAFLDFGANRDRCRRARTVQSAAHRRSDRTSATAARQLLVKTGPASLESCSRFPASKRSPTRPA